MNLMPIDHIEDWERRIERQDAFWRREIIDRPVVCFTLPRKGRVPPLPAQKHWPSIRDRWLDTEYNAELNRAQTLRTEFFGDALPHFYPRLGPEIFSALFGCDMEYGETTGWSTPILHDWADAGKLRLSRDNFYWKKLVEMTDAFLDAGRNACYTGTTDWHPGADAIAAFRDPVNLNIDMIEHPDEVRALLRRVNDAYFEVFDFFHEKLTAAGQPGCTWLGVVSTKKWYVPSNDFSCMISKQMFDETFLPGIIEECRHMEANCYHLDGPNALRHLDSLLAIEELNAIQWVYGAGRGCASDWMPVYKKCQTAGKGLQLGLGVDELDLFMENLRPEGLWIGLGGVKTRSEAAAVLKKIAAWR